MNECAPNLDSDSPQFFLLMSLHGNRRMAAAVASADQQGAQEMELRIETAQTGRFLMFVVRSC